MEILELINLDLDVWVKALMSESCVVFLKKKKQDIYFRVFGAMTGCR